MNRAKNTAYLNHPICIFETGGVSQNNAAKARAEEQAIRKELGMSAPFVPLKQKAAMIIRRLSPRLYWMIRNRYYTLMS